MAYGAGRSAVSLAQLLPGEGMGLGCLGHKTRSIHVCLGASMVPVPRAQGKHTKTLVFWQKDDEY